MTEQERDKAEDPDQNIPDVDGARVTPETPNALGVEPLKPPDPNTPLDELLEAERITLMQVCSIMRCLKEVLLYSDDDDGTMHSDVADLSRRLLDDSIARLEIIKGRMKEGLAHPPNQRSPPP